MKKTVTSQLEQHFVSGRKTKKLLSQTIQVAGNMLYFGNLLDDQKNDSNYSNIEDAREN